MIGDIFCCGEDLGARKIRIVVGFVLAGGLYIISKYGSIDPVGDERALSEMAAAFWAQLPRAGTKQIPIYGYHLGVFYDVDENGIIIGDWPQVGTLWLPYIDAFLMPGGNLPPDRAHLRLLCLPGGTMIPLE